MGAGHLMFVCQKDKQDKHRSTRVLGQGGDHGY